jgi:hypothetical protein
VHEIVELEGVGDASHLLVDWLEKLLTNAMASLGFHLRSKPSGCSLQCCVWVLEPGWMSDQNSHWKWHCFDLPMALRMYRLPTHENSRGNQPSSLLIQTVFGNQLSSFLDPNHSIDERNYSVGETEAS